MKKIIVGLAAMLVGASVQIASATYLPGAQGSGIAVGTEWFFNQQDISTPKTQAQCSEFWGQETYYLSGDADADGLPDLGKQWYFKDNFVYESSSATRGLALILPRYSTYNGTTVSYYTPYSNMLNVYNAGSQYPLSSQKAWYRYSKVAPLNQPVRAVTSEPLLMEVPSSRLPADAKFQLVFDINFAVFSSWGTSTSDYFVATVPSLADLNPIPASSKWYLKSGLTNPDGPLRSNDFLNQTTSVAARSINWSSEIQHGSECVNVTLKWCGDGILDTSYGEACDLGAQNGQPGAQCTATCTLPPVVQDPDVTIVKTVVGATTGYLNNDIVTYRLLYRNIGTGLANNVIIKDSLPAGVTYVSSTSTPNIGQPTQAANILTWPTISTLAPGAQGEIIVQVRITQFAACMPYTNTSSISASNEPAIYNGNNTSSADFTTECPNPDVVTQKSVSAISGSYLPGQTVEYTLTYQNIGAAVANGVVVTDTLPSQVTYVVGSSTSTAGLPQPTVVGQTLTWNVGSLNPGQSGQIKIRVTIRANTPTCTNLIVRNDFTISATNEPSTLLGNNPSNATFPMQCVDLWSNKVVDKPTVVSGDIVTYTITYGNSGNVAWPGTVTDTLPAGMQYVVGSSTSNPNVGQPTVAGQVLTWNVGVLPVGSSRTITIQAKVIQATAGQTYLNTVCIADDNNYNNNNCGNATSTTTGGNPNFIDLWSNKVVDKPIVVSGDIVTYTISYGNLGNVAATGMVTDTLPAGMQYVVGSSTSNPNVGQPTVVGQVLTWNVGTLPAGSSRTITIQARVIQANPGQTYLNTVCIADDNNYNNNNCGNATSTTTGGSAYIDLNINKLANGVKVADVFSGDIVDFTLIVGNSGTVAATGFSVNDYLPVGFTFVQASAGGAYNSGTRVITWNGLNLAAGASTTLTFKATYTDSVERTNYTEVCTYNGVNGTGAGVKDIDSDPCNRGANPPVEDDESSATVRPRSTSNMFDLSINKLIDGVKVKQGAVSGQTYPITLTVTNSGGVGVSNFSVKDYMPVGLEYVVGSANPATVTYDSGTRIVTFNSLNIGPQGTITLTFNAVYIDVVNRINYTEICDYRGTLASGNDAKDIDSNPCNRGPNLPVEDDESSAQIGPGGGGGGGPTVDVTLNKLVNGVKEYQANNGETVTFTLRATNEGNTTINNVSIVDYLPANVEYVSGSASTIAPATVTYDSTTRRLVWSGLTFTNNSAFDLTFRAVYSASEARTNFAEVCAYNGKTVKNGLPSDPSDPDSDPCNRGANPPVEDDESSAVIRPKSGGCTGNCGGTRNYCGDGLIARPNSYGQYEECDEGSNNGKPGYNCSLTCKSTGGSCGDGVLQYGEVCDQGPNGGRIPAGRPYAGRVCTSSCSLPGVAAPACDYIDPPSIMSNEYLPYRWDLEDIDNLQTSCTNAGAVIRDSLMCKFEVTDSKGSRVANANGEFTWIAPCNDPVADRLTKTAYIQVIKSLGYDPDSSQIRPYGFSSSKFNFTYLGEHKISMRLESYKMCVSATSGSGFVQQEVTFDQMSKKRVCEMNFAVTKPYMVSRGPLGNFSTDSLTSFLYMPNGAQVFTSPVPQITQKFDVTSEVTASVNKLVNEYKKVAVVATALPQFGNVLKVPGKDIYFFEGNTDAASITVSDTSVTSLGTKPFTIIVTKGQLIVKGDLTKASNGMYINASTNGSIKFAMDDKAGVNGVKGCDVTQVVNGIFISMNSLVSLNHEGNPVSVANTDINKDWCNGGDLTIRGVLIGNGVNNIVNLRRSNVNTWFTELTQINADRKEYLLNHGAVVLKYNPTLFDNLPPGAEVLSQVLSTYKK